jgi:hypothetical protein
MATAYDSSNDYDADLGYQGVVVRILRPIEDISMGGWQSTPLYEHLNDSAEPNDSDYIISPYNPGQDDIAEVKLGSTTDPSISTGHKIVFRYKKNIAGTPFINLTVSLVQGTTVIGSTMLEDIGDDWVTGEYTLTESEADAITDYTDLRIRFQATFIGQIEENITGQSLVVYQTSQTQTGISVVSTDHLEVSDWLTIVGSGNVSSGTRTALNTFFQAIDAVTGLRAKIIRLNLFCGNSVTEALVPQIKSTSRGGSTIGNSDDTLRDNSTTNSGWSYTETGSSGGLQSGATADDGTGRPASYIHPGIDADDIGNTGALGFYLRTSFTATASKGYIGYDINTGVSPNPWCRIGWSNTDDATSFVWRTGTAASNGFVPSVSETTASTGFWLGSRTANNDARLYKNGTQMSQATGSATMATLTSTAGFGIFTAHNGTNWTGYYQPSIRSGGYIIATGLDSTEAAAISSAFEAFNDALSRGLV